MENEIIEKIRKELNKGIITEAQTVYLLVEIRKLFEHRGRGDPQYNILKLFCDWALHIRLSGNHHIKSMLCEFDEGIEKIEQGYGSTAHDYLSLAKLRIELDRFFSDYRLPCNLLNKENWQKFVRLYSEVVSDCPITKQDYPFKFIKEIRIDRQMKKIAETDPSHLREQQTWLRWHIILKDDRHIFWEFIG